MPNYKNSIVYKLCCNDTAVTEVYVGSTTNFKNRKSDHKKACCKESYKGHNLYVYRFIRDNGGWSNWSMVQLEAIELNTKRELHARERHWLETLGASLNKIVPLRTRAEYREANRERLNAQKKLYDQANKEKKKVYREANREAILAYYKQYNQANKEKKKQHYHAKKDVKPCSVCGGKFNHGDKRTIKRHAKSKRHIKAL